MVNDQAANSGDERPEEGGEVGPEGSAPSTPGARPALSRPAAGDTWVIDLDGVIWLAGQPIAGGGQAVARLRSAGARAMFATNNSSPTVSELLRRLARAGIDAGPGDVVSSAQAAASMVDAGDTVLLLAAEGVEEALAARGVTVVEHGPADVVVVGWTRRFDFDRLAVAATAVREGARLVGTNEDPTHPTPSGLLPGGGALLAAVAAAAGAVPEIAGKPHAPMADLVRARAGKVAVVVGDRPSTDGALARRVGAPFALVLSGVTAAADVRLDPAPDAVAESLAALVEGACNSRHTRVSSQHGQERRVSQVRGGGRGARADHQSSGGGDRAGAGQSPAGPEEPGTALDRRPRRAEPQGE